MKYFFAIILCVGFVSASVTPNSGELSSDDRATICEVTYVDELCSGFNRGIDSINRFLSPDLESGISEANSVRDSDRALLDEELRVTQERVGSGWNNILSLVYLVIEVVMILFYLAQIFILVHLPYYYVKVLVWVKKQVGNSIK